MTEWIYGRRTVAEHLAAAPETCRTLLLAAGATVPADILEPARKLGLEARTVERAELDRLLRGGNHQGVGLAVGGWAYQELDDLARGAEQSGRLPLLLALDGVQDPRNLGAVLRVADGVGAVGVVIPKDRAAGLSAAVARTAAGALASVPVARVVNLARALDALRARGFWVLGSSDTAEQELHDAPVRFPCVLVLGGEHRGARPNVVRRWDAQVRIPMAGRVASLNAAVACGVLCYEILRRHRFPAFPLDTP